MTVHDRWACQKVADNTFGPVVASCARVFDFTLSVEQAILGVPQHAAFLLLVPWSVRRLRSSTVKVRRHGWMSWAKFSAALLLVATQIMLLAFYCQPKAISTKVSIPSTVLSLSAAMAVVPLSYLEHHRSVRPSTLLSSYLVLSIILDLPQARTLYLIPDGLRIAVVFSAALGVKSALLLLEAKDKTSYLMEPYQTLPIETTRGILSRSLFLWMNGLFRQGYHKVISFEDLGRIDDPLTSPSLHRHLQQVWNQQKGQRTSYPLLWSLWIALRWSLLSPVPPRLCCCGFLFAQPFLIEKATLYVSQRSNAVETDIGYGLIGATACVYLGIAISTALFQHQLYRHITMVRGSLVALIYTESLALEDQNGDLSAPVTLMSTDVDRICQSLVLMHDLWARPLELAVGISLLARQIGWVCVMPVAVVLLSALADTQVTRLIGGRVKVWTDAVQHRISWTGDVLTSMKSVKIIGFAGPLSALLQTERVHELRLQAKFRWSSVLLNTFGNVPLAITAAITFLAYAIKARVDGSGFLSTSQVFTSLALIMLVTTPASDLLAAFPFVASCLGCLERIQQHLLRPSYSDLANHVVAEADLSEKAMATITLDASAAGFSTGSVVMQDATSPLLQNFNLEFRPHTFTIILGPSGSVKSTLLRALLAQVGYRGNFAMGLCRISFCPQTPWIFSGTVRQNICGLETGTIDKSWYQAVFHACALDDVFASLRHGDHTYLAGQSCSLSGGQRQRLVLARTLYQRPQLLLLDDVLSALDLRTEKQIMARLFGPAGLICQLKATVVLVTHATRWVAMADNVIILDGERNLKQSPQTPCPYSEPIPPGSDDSSEPRSVDAETADTAGQNTSPNAAIPSRGSETEDYVFYFKSVRLPVALLLVFFAAAQSLCYYLSQLILKWWSADDGSGETKWLPTYILLSVGNAVFYGCMAWTMFLKWVPQSAANLHRYLLDVVMNAPYAFFMETDVGVMLNRFSQDMSLIESQLPTGVMCTLLYVLWTLGSLALISTGSTWMALSIPAVLGAVYLLQQVYLRTARRLRALDLELRSPVYNHFLESLKGLSTIRTLHWEGQFTEAMIEKLDASQVPYYLLFCAQRWLQLVLDLIVAALAIVVVAFAVNLRGYTQPASL